MGTRQAGDPPLYYANHVFVCTNRRPDGHRRGSCAERGAEELRDYMKARARALGLDMDSRINNSGCLDRCELGPCVVAYPEGVWYRIGSKADVDAFLETHMRDGARLPDQLLPPEVRGG